MTVFLVSVLSVSVLLCLVFRFMSLKAEALFALRQRERGVAILDSVAVACRCIAIFEVFADLRPVQKVGW